MSTSEAEIDPESGDRIDRVEALRALLSSTGRGAVPIRGAFVQSRRYRDDGTRKGPLASFTGDAPALEAYLLIHALASSSAPYGSSYPAITWAHISGMTSNAEDDSARQRWSKAIQKLKKLQLIEATRDGRGARYTLLHESGNGQPYTRPKTVDGAGGWLPLPHAYWLDGVNQDLSHPERVMLLVALDQKEPFELPSTYVPTWYGIPEATAKRGLGGLLKRGILTAEKRTEFKLKSTIKLKTVNVYRTTGIWTKDQRIKAMTVERGPSAKPSFAPSSGASG